MSMIFWITVLPITDTNTPWNAIVLPGEQPNHPSQRVITHNPAWIFREGFE